MSVYLNKSLFSSEKAFQFMRDSNCGSSRGSEVERSTTDHKIEVEFCPVRVSLGKTLNPMAYGGVSVRVCPCGRVRVGVSGALGPKAQR